MCKTCKGTGRHEIAVERIVGSRRGVHSTAAATRSVPCTDCNAYRSIVLQSFVVQNDRIKGRTWPMYADDMGVAPSQIAEAVELDRKLGVNIDYSSEGHAVYRDAAQRKAHCEAHGYFDKSNFGGSGDPQRGKCRAYDPEYKAWAEKR